MWQTGLTTVGLLVVANVFMTLAWYGHLKLQSSGVSSSWPLYVVIIFSWLIALVEYALQVPANRMGFVGNGGPFTLMQLKVMQEAITLVVFTIMANFMFQGSELRWNHLVAFILLIGAVYFVFMDTSK
ncbi:MAG: DMT family protein [Rikenellaceae bacterium]